MTIFKRIIINSTIIIVILFSILIFLIINSSSLHLIIKSTIRFVPEISIGQLTGNWKNLSISNISYKKNNIKFKIEKFNLIINPIDLLSFNICLQEISLKNVNIKINKEIKKNFSGKFKYKFINIFFPIKVKKINVNNINMLIGNTNISVLHLNSGFFLKNHFIKINSTLIDELSIFPINRITNKSSSLFNVNKNLTKISFNKLINKNTFFKVPFNIDIENILIKNFNNNYINFKYVLAKIKLNNNLLKLTTLELYTFFGKTNIRGSINLLKNYSMQIIIKNILNFSKFKNQKILINLNGNILNKIKIKFNINNIIHFKTYLIINTKQKLRSTLSFIFNIPKIVLSRNNFNYYELNDVKGIIDFTFNHYLIFFKSKLNSNTLFPMNIIFKGKGDLKQFKINAISIYKMNTVINLTSLIKWHSYINLYSKLLVLNTNFLKKNNIYPIKLNGEIIIQGNYFYDNSWELTLSKVNFHGFFRKYPINSYGSIIINSHKLFFISNFKFLFNENIINLNGNLGKKINLNIKINAKNINNFLPKFKGQIYGNINIIGSIFIPKITTKIFIRNFSWNMINIDVLNIISLINYNHINKINLYIKNIKKDLLYINKLSLNVIGSLKKHQIMLKTNGVPISSNLLLNGSFNKKTNHWYGKIRNMNINSIFGKWKLSNIIEIFYLKEKKIITISPHCWQKENSNICIMHPMKLGLLNIINISFNKFDFKMLNSLFNKYNLNFFKKNTFNGKIYFYWNVLNKTSNFSFFAKQINYKNKLSTLNSSVNLNFNLFKNKIYFNGFMNINNKEILNSKIYIYDYKNKKNINGNIKINNFPLTILNYIFFQKENIKGIINSKLKINGSLYNPKIFGQLILKKIDTTILPLNIFYSKLNIFFNGNKSQIYSLIKTAEGNINLYGNFFWNNLNDWHLFINSKSKLDKIILSPSLKISVISNFTFKAKPNNYYIFGNLNIPWARIVLKKIPNDIVESSLDEVILHKHSKYVFPSTFSIFIKKNIIFDLGEDVQLSTLGFNVKLKGKLKLLNNQYSNFLNGKITIPSGKFHAYGQDLIVRKGDINFIGSFHNPYINLEAIRNIELTEDSVIVGLRINGFINDPKLDIFTEPKMSKQLAMSYLLYGKGILDNNNDDNLITSAILGLSIFHGEHIIYKIGKKLGISNLVLNTINIGSNQQIQISSYIMRDLQIKYGFNILNSFVSFTIRYRLLPNLYLEIVSGINKTLDVLYHFEF